MRSLILAFFLLHLPAHASGEQEVLRLQHEMDRLSLRSAWGGVERHYDSIVKMGERPDRKHTLLAADAARHRGDVLTVLERLVQAQSMEVSDDVTASIEDLMGRYGRVQLLSTESAELRAVQTPFRPDVAAAVRLAVEYAATTEGFDGFLPDGDYRFGDVAFTVRHGEELQVISLDKETAGISDLTLSNVTFPAKASVGGNRLLRNGVGVRSKLMVNVYAAALYLQEQTDSSELAIRQDLAKRLVMHITFRRITKEQFISHFEDDFRQVRGHEKTADDIQRFVNSLPDMVQGDRLVMDYVPGRGTTVTLNGHRLVLVEGRRFMWVLFRLFLGEHPPTEKLKRGLLGG